MKKSKPGPKGKERSDVLVRLDPAVAAWLTKLGERAGRSRNECIARWIETLRNLLLDLEDDFFAGMTPSEVMRTVGAALSGSLVDGGMASDVLREAYDGYRREQRELLAKLTRGQERR